IEVHIDSIRVSLMSQLRVVILKDAKTGRYLPIFIGPFEAEAIAVKLQKVDVERPLTHDLLKSVITELGGHVHHIVVNDLRNDTFFARIVVERDGRTQEIDSRPSHAIALAVRLVMCRKSWSTTSATTRSFRGLSSSATGRHSSSTRAPATRSCWPAGSACRSTSKRASWIAPRSTRMKTWTPKKPLKKPRATRAS